MALSMIGTMLWRQKRACCRYQSLVLYLLVQRGSSLVIPISAFRKAGKNDAF
jgi:hypothetical protein